MANHFQCALELLDEVDQARTELRRAYSENAGPHIVARLHQTINVCMRLADVHAQLAEVQAITDAGQLLDVKAS